MAGRPRFDREAVLDAAMRVFWEKSYAAATLDDLTAATGLKRGSLYNAFGSKEGLFLAAFAHYGTEVEERALAALAAPDLDTALAGLFAHLLDRGERPPGCLIAQTLAEAGHAPTPIGTALRARIAATEARLAARLAAEPPERLPAAPATLARFLHGQMRAASLLAKTGDPARAAALARIATAAATLRCVNSNVGKEGPPRLPSYRP